MRFTGLQIDTNKLLCLYGELIDEIYGKVYEVVRRNGGIVDMSDPELDNAYALVYTGDREGVETQITAVRANEDGSLDIQVAYYDYAGKWYLAYYDDEWLSLRYAEHEFHKALLSIAENIFEFIPVEDDRQEP